jgi:hypothetical protein
LKEVFLLILSSIIHVHFFEQRFDILP